MDKLLLVINILACIVTFIGTREVRKAHANLLRVNSLYLTGSICFFFFFLFQAMYWNAVLYIFLGYFGLDGILTHFPIKELKFFIVDKHKIKGIVTYCMNQKSNAIMNIKMPFPVNIFCYMKAMILEFLLAFILPNKKHRASNFASLYHLVFRSWLDSDHYCLKTIFDFFIHRLK